MLGRYVMGFCVACVLTMPAMATALDVGDRLPAIALRDWQGQPLVIDATAQRVFVVDFWASWCMPCRTLLPALSKLGQAVPQARIYSVNIDADRAAAQGLLETLGPLPGVTLVQDPSGRLLADFGAPSMPSLFVIVDGRVHAVHSGFSTTELAHLEAELSKLVAP